MFLDAIFVIVILSVSASQPEKALSPIDITLSGITNKPFRFEQLKNVSSYIESICAADKSISESNPWQFLNEPEPK